MIKVILIPILSDNYAYLLKANNGQTAIVDPGEAAPIIEVLETKNIKPDVILLTHHHWDHVDGLEELLAWHACPVYGPVRDNSRLKRTPDSILGDGDRFEFGGEDVEVLHTPGHTREHVCLYFPKSDFVLSGDALFVMGCGRLIDGTPDEMFTSLQKLAALPDTTQIYCGHEYTLANAEFCKHVEPNNTDIAKRLKNIEMLRSTSEPTIPSTIAQEKQTNVFMRADNAALFAERRQQKDSY